MKVYVVVWETYGWEDSAYKICGVFTSEADAEVMVVEQNAEQEGRPAEDRHVYFIEESTLR